MAKQKKGTKKISDITEDKELNEKDLQQVSGGMLKKPIFKAADDCNGNCVGSVHVSTGKDVDL
jgi:bacteriocin-like protein